MGKKNCYIRKAVADTWSNIEGGQAYCFDKMTSQTTNLLKNIGGSPPGVRHYCKGISGRKNVFEK